MPIYYGSGGITCRTMRKAKQPLAKPNEGRRAVVCVETGEVFLNLTQAVMTYGGSIETLRAALNHERAEAFGLHWEWSEPGKLYQKRS